MLETLHIQNYALIDDLEVEFEPGFNVLTGETGAGKSIIVGALNLVLGARASSEVVRQGQKKAKIEALFRIPEPSKTLQTVLERHAIELEEDGLLLARVVSAEGRSKAYAGGALVPVAVLAEIGDELVDMHGQHEHQSLLKPDRQLELLDAYAGTEALAAETSERVSRLRRVEKELEELEQSDRERERRLEFLRFEVDEIDSAGLAPGEEEELRVRRNLIANAEQVVQASGRAYQLLYESDGSSANDAVGEALSEIEALVRYDERFRTLAERLDRIRAEVEETATEIRGYSEGVDFEPEELETLNARLALLGGLKRKYGENVDAVLAYREKAAAELDRFEQRDQHLDRLRKEQAGVLQEATTAAETLSGKRKKAAAKLDKAITGALAELGMKGGRFQTRFEGASLSRTGIDKVTFELSANPGEPLKPLRQVASGGEVSRVMLAVKTVFADADRIPTLIFDEIDAGVGGAVALKVADRLRGLAGSHQTICVTHLAQIAASAQAHFRVSKTTSKGRTQTAVSHVGAEDRLEELARLLGGSVSERGLEHARELLAKH